MDKPYTWKRTEETEIDLADLLRRLCGKWKQLAACALAAAALLGGYGWLKGRDVQDTAQKGAAQEAELTEEEEKSVADAVQLTKDVDSLQEYLDNSVLMKLDAYHKDKYVMLYCIDHAKRQELPRITESYLNFLLNGGAADALEAYGSKDWKMDKSYLSELVSAYQKTYSSPYQIAVAETSASGMFSESLFYVEITGQDAKAAEQMALDMQEILARHAKEVQETAGSHKLTLISSAKNVTADSGLQAQQQEKRALLSTSQANLKAMTDAFSKEQHAVYLDTAGMDKKEKQKALEEETGSQSGIPFKYIVLGLFGGVFAYCGAFACWYVLRDTVKSVAEMKRLYTFPCYGGIPMAAAGVKTGRVFLGKMAKQGGLPGASAIQGGQEYAKVCNRIRLACKKQGVAKLCAASDFPLQRQEKECLAALAGQLKGFGIELELADNALGDTDIWDSLAKTGQVLMVCRIGTTTHRMVDDAMGFYLENGIAVTGAVAFLPVF